MCLSGAVDKCGGMRHLLLLLLGVLGPAAAARLRPQNAHLLDQQMDNGYSEEVAHDVYLMRLGYLPQSDIETGNLRTQEEMSKAIRNFQHFANIPETGEWDEKTKAMAKKPRCGLPDLQEWRDDTRFRGRARRHHHGNHRRSKRYALGPSRWEKNTLTWRILSYTPDLNHHETRHALQRAFQLWMEAANLTFHEVQQGDADIRIQFGRYFHHDGYPFDGPGNILAHAFFPGEGRGGDMHFDEDEHWTVYTPEGVNLYSVAAHELGHSLGLAHSSVEGALMYPWYQGFQEDLKLDWDDVSIIQWLYGKSTLTTRAPPREPPTRDPPTRRPRPTPPRPTPRMPPTPPRPTPPAPPTVPADPDEKPDPCSTSIDAISVIRSEVFIFKDQWFWRLDENGTMPGYPVKYNLFWYNHTEPLEKFDAVYERHGDGKITFFRGSKYWLYEGNMLTKGFNPAGQPLTELGLPQTVERIDAAFVWGYNQRTYFISGDMYWRFNEATNRVFARYPRDMSIWEGVPLPVDAAFQHTDGKTYFFKGQEYFTFKDVRMKVDKTAHPLYIGSRWLPCKDQVRQPRGGEHASRAADAGRAAPPPLTLLLLSLLLLLVT